MLNRLRYFLIGSPLPTQALSDTRLSKVRALGAFSPDALSSIAYANQEIYLGLIVAGSVGLGYTLPIGITIAGLLVLLALSYFQTIHGYPSGGGSYVVARENLGTYPGLIAAAALLIDYLLTAAVSLSAGVEAFASAFPVLWPHRVGIALVLLVFITLLNMRGIRETGFVMSIPVYFFVVTFIGMLIYGVVRAVLEGPGGFAATAPLATQPVTLVLILHTFSSGCTALTGIEAISNGVPAFKPPEARNAGRTLIVMAILMGVLLLGSLGLTQYLAVVAGPDETILSALARRILGTGFGYYLIQIGTMLILAVAANTSFAGFPRLAAVLASHGYAPRQLTNLGDRLVYQNGNLILALGTAILLVAFNGDTHLLIPLFAVGVFLAFTLSQAGMVVHWWREHRRGWFLKALINGLGGLATAVTLLVVGYSKFLQGAWISILLIPILVWVFIQVHRHYNEVAQELSLKGLPPSLRPAPPMRVVIPVSGVHRGVVEAINIARSISNDVTAVYVELEPGMGDKVRAEWDRWWPDVHLAVIPSPYRSIIQPFLSYLDQTDREHNDGTLAAVVMPEFIPAHWWQGLLHNQTAFVMKNILLYGRRRLGYTRVIIDVPFHLRK
jgi:amino acid transporter